MWWKRRFTTWMSRRQININCMMGAQHSTSKAQQPHSLGLVHLWEEIRQCVGRAPYRKAPGRSESNSCGAKYSVLFRSDCKMSSSLVFKFRFFLEIIEQVLSIGRVMSLRIYGCSSVFHTYAREDFACLQLKITSWS